MDEPHLLAATRYIALDPVAAGLVSRAEDWPWSRAPAHLAGVDDETGNGGAITCADPRFCCASHGAGRSRDDGSDRADTHDRTPVGTPEWIAALERQFDRRSAPGKPGSKPRLDGATSGNCRCCEVSGKLSAQSPGKLSP